MQFSMPPILPRRLGCNAVSALVKLPKRLRLKVSRTRQKRPSDNHRRGRVCGTVLHVENGVAASYLAFNQRAAFCLRFWQPYFFPLDSMALEASN